MRGVRPRPVLWCSFSFERLVLAEIRDRQTQWINGDELVRNAGLKDKYEVRGIKVALELAVIRRRVVNEVEVHTRAIRRILQLFERYLLHVDIDLRGRGVGEEFPHNVVLVVRIENAARELAVQKVDRFRKIILNGV